MYCSKTYLHSLAFYSTMKIIFFVLFTGLPFFFADAIQVIQLGRLAIIIHFLGSDILCAQPADGNLGADIIDPDMKIYLVYKLEGVVQHEFFYARVNAGTPVSGAV